MTSRELDCKIVLLGKESTGKSCLSRRFVEDVFEDKHPVTVGTSYAAKKMETSKGRVVVSLWDTAGAEKYDSLTRLYYTGASAALVCIDPTDGSSFSKAQYWVKELKQHQPDCRCYIVLTKCDLLEQSSAANGASGSTSGKVEALDRGHPEAERSGSGEGRWRGGGSSASARSVKGHSKMSPTSPFEREYSGDIPDATGSSEAHSPQSPWQLPKSPATTSAAPKRPRKEVGDSQLASLASGVAAQVVRTSAATGQGVVELFQMVAEDLAAAPATSSPRAEGCGGGEGASAVATEPQVVLRRVAAVPDRVRRQGEAAFSGRSRRAKPHTGACCS